MSRRLTCDRFYGGVHNRIPNLQSFLAYLWRTSPTTNEAAAWIATEFDGTSETTRDRYLSFLRGLNLVERVGGHLYPGPAGIRYLRDPDAETLFRILDAGVAGFDLLLEALATRSSLTDEDLRLVLNAGPYGHDMDGIGVAIRHREWLQALGYARREQGSRGTRHTVLTTAGYDLWNTYENGQLELTVSEDNQQSRMATPLQEIPDNPVPDTFDTATHEPDSSEDDDERTDTTEQTARLQAAAQEHQRALARLRDRFEDAGYTVYKTRYSDLLAVRNDDEQPFLFEVKSITDDNAWSQTRTAVGQVLEYAFTDIKQRDAFSGSAKLGILLSSPPPTELQDYLSHLATTREFFVVWWDETLAGPSYGRLQDHLR